MTLVHTLQENLKPAMTDGKSKRGKQFGFLKLILISMSHLLGRAKTVWPGLSYKFFIHFSFQVNEQRGNKGLLLEVK